MNRFLTNVNKVPLAILDLYKPFNNRLEKITGISKIYLKHPPKTDTLKNSFIYKITDIYNSLDMPLMSILMS